MQTARLLTDAPMRIDDRLREAHRTATPSAAEVAKEAISEADRCDVVLIGHGTALTLLVADLVGRPPDIDAWQAMLLPDHCRVTVREDGAAEIGSPWGAWAT